MEGALSEFVLKATLVGHVACEHESRKLAVDVEVISCDLHIDNPTVAKTVTHLPRGGPGQATRYAAQGVMVLLGPDVQDRPCQKLIARVPVLGDGRFIHAEESQGSGFKYVHGSGVAIEEEPV